MHESSPVFYKLRPIIYTGIGSLTSTAIEVSSLNQVLFLVVFREYRKSSIIYKGSCIGSFRMRKSICDLNTAMFD